MFFSDPHPIKVLGPNMCHPDWQPTKRLSAIRRYRGINLICMKGVIKGVNPFIGKKRAAFFLRPMTPVINKTAAKTWLTRPAPRKGLHAIGHYRGITLHCQKGAIKGAYPRTENNEHGMYITC